MLGISTELALMNSTHSMSDILSSNSILMRVGKSTEKEKRATLYYYFRHKFSNITNRPYTIKFISKCQEFVGRYWCELNHLHTNYNHEVLHLHTNYNHEVLHLHINYNHEVLHLHTNYNHEVLHLHTNYNHELLHLHINYNHEVLHLHINYNHEVLHLHTNYNHELLHLHINYNHEVLHNSSPLGDETFFKRQNHFVCELKTINHQRFYTTS